MTPDQVIAEAEERARIAFEQTYGLRPDEKPRPWHNFRREFVITDLAKQLADET